MRNFTHRWIYLGHFFPKSGHFFLNFEKGQRRPPPSLYLSSYTPANVYNFIAYNHWIINNTFQILPILRNTCARIPTLIFFTRTIFFTLAFTVIFIPFFIWITFCTIEFAFTVTWNMFYQRFCFVSSYYHIEHFNIYIFCFTGNTYFFRLAINSITTSITYLD